jgi:hypothetical protein
MGKNNKAQTWFTDFVIGTLIFTFMLIAYYTYTSDISKQNSLTANDLISDAESVSSLILSTGFPDNWDDTTVQSIGITNNNQRINRTKFNEFRKIGYGKSKNLFGTSYDYFLFFINGSGDVQNVEGSCGTGSPEVGIDYDIAAAYYYRGPGEEEYLKSFMEEEFDADVYRENGAEGINDLDALIDNFNNYGIVVMESPELPTSVFNDFSDAAESYVNNGGLLMLGGELVSAQGKTLAGATFYKTSGQSESDRLATVVREDIFLAFWERENIVFSQAYYVENSDAEDFTDIARFNESDIEFEDILDNKIALARWKYGSGKVLFFSDFNAEYFSGNFQESLKASAAKWIGAACSPVDISNINIENLVRIDRLLIYDSRPVKMVLYLWQ